MVPAPSRTLLPLLLTLASAGALSAQAPEGPLPPPRPGQTVQQAPPLPQVKVKVALVNTAVTVRDSQGRLVDDLIAADFRVTDNGVEQKISHFDFGGDPVSVAILIETSSRIDPLLPELRKTGILLTQNVMGAQGEAAVVGFHDGVDKLQDFTTNADLIENTVAHLQSGGSKSRLYDAMSVGVEMLGSQPQPSVEQPGRRRVLLVLSESMDDGSETKLGQVLRQAQLANVTIYSIGLSTLRSELHSKPRDSGPTPIAPPGINTLPPMPGTIQTPETEALRTAGVDLLGLAAWAVQHVNDKVKDHAMAVAAAGTGGLHLSTYKDHSVEDAIDEIAAELHSQYALSYAPSAGGDLGYHEIKVQVDRKDLAVRARPGYYVAPPES